MVESSLKELGIGDIKDIKEWNLIEVKGAKKYPLWILTKEGKEYLVYAESFNSQKGVVAARKAEIEEDKPNAEVVVISDEAYEDLKNSLLSLQEENESEEDSIVSKAQNLVNEILRDAVSRGITDVSIAPTVLEESDKAVYRVRFGIGKEYSTVKSFSLSVGRRVVNRLAQLSGVNLSDYRPQSGSFYWGDKGKKKIRSEFYYVELAEGHGVSLRFQDLLNIGNLKLSKLGMEEELLRKYEEYLSKTRGGGLIIDSGETGGGKTTTLAASLVYLIEKSKRGGDPTIEVRTIEDPVEYPIPGAVQIEYKPEYGNTFPEVIKSCLRQNPNVILIGEIRDKETAKVAVEASITGHLVLTTVHANSAVAVLYRMRDLGVPLETFINSVSVILNQTLVKKVCPNCRIPLSEEELSLYGLKKGYRIGKGCEKCNGTGIVGRTALFEALFPLEYPEIKRLFLNSDELALKRFLREKGFKTLWQKAKEKVEKGIIPVEDWLSLPKDPVLDEQDAEERDSLGFNINLGTVVYPEYRIPVKVISGGEEVEGYLYDVSDGGISIIYDEAGFFPLRSEMKIRIELPKGGKKEGRFYPKRFYRNLAYRGMVIVGGVWKGDSVRFIWKEFKNDGEKSG